MGDVLNKGSHLFPAELVTEMFNAVKGKSSLAKLSKANPIAFAGTEIMTFNFDREVDIVAESGAKSKGGVTATAVTLVPIKFEYGARVSDEFLNAAEEVRLDYLKNFAEGFAKKLARGMDIAAMHGTNPRTGSASTVVGDNNLDSKATQMVTYVAASADDNLNTAAQLVIGSDGEVTGIALSPTMGAALSGIKVNGVPQYPEFRFGRTPENFYGMPVDVNSTVSVGNVDYAILGDFANAFKWGYAKDVTFEVIKYGNPDNDATLGDLKGHNQVYLRAEAYIGWGILDAVSFARVVKPTAVTITAAADGTSGSETSTKITLTFNVDVYGLKAEHITLADGTGDGAGAATKGALTGSGKNWELALTAVTTQGNVSLTIADIGGFDFPSTGTTVAVYKESNID